MSGFTVSHWRRWALRALVAALGIGLLVAQFSAPVTAGSGDRTLYLYHTHTHETGRFTFKHNGQYDQKVLGELNVFLADWRTHEPTHMAPQLFDLIWEIYQEVGATQPVNIVSSYRSPKTNAMLRATTSGVAENSQHMQGKAMDIFIPGVSLTRLREAAMRHQVGGVGYYPTSGSPFVHVDVGSVRAWPRMTLAQLKKIFPDGKTLHLPPSGTPLSVSGRQFAMVQWSKCHEVPCGSTVLPAIEESPQIQLASLDPAQRSVPTIDIVAPVPQVRPGGFIVGDAGTAIATASAAAAAEVPGFGDAPVPMLKSHAMMLATRDPLPTDQPAGTALVALANIGAPLPQARTVVDDEDAAVMTAYAADIAPGPDAQRALDALIRTASIPDLPAARGTTGLDAFKNVFDMTWSAVGAAGRGSSVMALAELVPAAHDIPSLKRHPAELVAPEIEHVTETMMTPVPMSSEHFAAFYDPEGYLDEGAELGPMAPRMGLVPDDTAPPGYSRFIRSAPMLVASR